MAAKKVQPDEETNAFIEGSEAETGSTWSDSDSESLRPCSKCGRPLAPDAVFCPKCGEKQDLSCCGRCGRCGWKCCCCCCCCLLVSTVLFAGLTAALILSMNTWVKVALEEVGSAVFGTDVTIGAMNLGLAHGRASITGMTVSSPPGYEGSFFHLGRFVFDVSPRSIVAAWFTGWIAPVNLQEITVRDIQVLIDMNWTTTKDKDTVSNAGTIVEHLNQAAEPLPTVAPETAVDVGLHAIQAKLKVGRVQLSNISAGVLLRPFLKDPVDYNISEILVHDIGQSNNGVYVWEFIEILTRAIMMAVVKAAPGNIRGNLAKIFGPTLWKHMDLSKIAYDAGEGLCEISHFSGWAAGEAALLPLKFTALQAKITGKAIQANIKATELGAKLTGMGIRANMAATNAQVKAGMKLAGLGMKLNNAFASGMMHAMR